MVKYKIRGKKDNYIIYDYYPECKEEYGTVKLDLTNGEVEHIKECNEKEYFSHVRKKLYESFENNEFKDEETIIWM